MKKTDDHEVVTKGYFRKELKKELNIFGQQLKYELRTEMDIKFEAFFENLRDWKDEILNGNDKLMRRFDAFEKENASMHLNYGYLKGDVEELQGRVTVLEKTA